MTLFPDKVAFRGSRKDVHGGEGTLFYSVQGLEEVTESAPMSAVGGGGHRGLRNEITMSSSSLRHWAELGSASGFDTIFMASKHMRDGGTKILSPGSASSPQPRPLYPACTPAISACSVLLGWALNIPSGFAFQEPFASSYCQLDPVTKGDKPCWSIFLLQKINS